MISASTLRPIPGLSADEVQLVGTLLEEALFPYSVDVVDDGPGLYQPLRDHIAQVGLVIYQDCPPPTEGDARRNRPRSPSFWLG